MRRAILVVTLGGLVLGGAACDSDAKSRSTAAPKPATTASAAASSLAPDYTADTKAVCGKLEKIFNDDLEGFGTQVGKMIAYKEAKKAPEMAQAQKAAGDQLKTVGAKVQQETAAAQDPDLKTAGATSAAKFVKSATDAAFFDKIKATTDLNGTIEEQMADWLNPVAGYCG
jgi:hypothetical protein